MTITMTGKNQITIPKKFVKALQLTEGALFDIKIDGNGFKIIPLETTERTFTDEEYVKLEKLYQKEKHLAKPVTKEFIKNL